jgi:probable H4MPT-linked C1 transfer pathway protein
MPFFDRLAVTMTGELCDCFASKREGVHAILHSIGTIYDQKRIRVWCAQGRFLSFDEAMDRPHSVAAANWLALAHLVAQRFPAEAVLLVDTGSTTTDITFLNGGVPEPRGLTDPARLASGELVYTGVRRTPVCAVLGLEVAAEFFATMLDACLILGLIAENAADRDTADGRPATRPFAHARLARMRCADTETFSEEDALSLAANAVGIQRQAVRRAVQSVVAGKPAVQRLVVAGSGEILARSGGWPDARVTSLADLLGPDISEAACAHAVAMLAAKEVGA